MHKMEISLIDRIRPIYQQLQVLDGVDHETIFHAETDITAVRSWLFRIRRNSTTLRVYRKEAGRFLVWCSVVRGLELKELTAADINAYVDFTQDIPSEWMTTVGIPFNNSSWRPFTGNLYGASLRFMFGILGNLFDFLHNGGYLRCNFFKVIRRPPSPETSLGQGRVFSTLQWFAIQVALDQLPKTSARDRAHYERARWVFSLLIGCALRRHEVLLPNSMSSFICCQDRELNMKWHLNIISHDREENRIPVGDEVILALKRYRTSLGFSELPCAGEKLPLVLTITGKPIKSDTTVDFIVKNICEKASLLLSPQSSAEAERLRKGSAHWLRHTSAVRKLAQNKNLRSVQMSLRHANISTTALYLSNIDD